MLYLDQYKGKPLLFISIPIYFRALISGYGDEISWLNKKGKAVVARSIFTFDSESLNLIESKSFKLYPNSYNQAHFESIQVVQNKLIEDLSKATQSNVKVE